jgi:molybdenum cofactor cytidylyltransferase
METQTTAHLLLAAGTSTRMGRPKQLLPWKGQSLIRHAIHVLQKAGLAQRIVVILGANRELITPELNDLAVEIVVNPDWAEGMGSSIRSGMQQLLKDDADEWSGIGISLVDQPLIAPEHFRALYQLWENAKQPIAAARYNDILGVPAIFDTSVFPQLLALDGAAGARKILMQSKERVAPLDLPEARFDLDTPEDYKKLFSK